MGTTSPASPIEVPAPLKFHLAVNLERMDAATDMTEVARHTLEMVQMADRGGRIGTAHQEETAPAVPRKRQSPDPAADRWSASPETHSARSY